MRPGLFIRYAIVLALAGAGPAQAALRIGELVVREGHGGVPCFTISEAEEKRSGAPSFQSIVVSEAGAKAPLWSMAMPSQRTFPVTFHMCVPYAGRLPVLPQAPAAELQPGRVYEVAIEARGPLTASAPRSYRAHFCAAKNAQGGAVWRTLSADSRQRYACGA